MVKNLEKDFPSIWGAKVGFTRKEKREVFGFWKHRERLMFTNQAPIMKKSDISEDISTLKVACQKVKSTFYTFSFLKKDRDDLKSLREMLESLGINCGEIHNPSMKVDKNYWRFFLSRKSHRKFMQDIGSWHPRRFRQIELRMKI